MGKTVFATDTDGSVVWDGGITTPFGESIALASAFTQNLMFPGQYADAETSLSHNHHRTYDPTLGRYLQPDPIGLAGGLNRYAYVGGNPVGYVDPDGEFGIVGALIGGGLNFTLQFIEHRGNLKCVDYADVLTSAFLGAVIPGALSSVKTIRTGLTKRKQMLGYLKRTRNKKNIRKFKRRLEKATNRIGREVGMRLEAESIKYTSKKMLNLELEKCGC